MLEKGLKSFQVPFSAPVYFMKKGGKICTQLLKIPEDSTKWKKVL
jgi:hypothetical protein